MRRLIWCTKQWQNIAQVLHNDRLTFPKDLFAILLYTNMVTVTSRENRKYDSDNLSMGMSFSVSLAPSTITMPTVVRGVHRCVDILGILPSSCFQHLWSPSRHISWESSLPWQFFFSSKNLISGLISPKHNLWIPNCWDLMPCRSLLFLFYHCGDTIVASVMGQMCWLSSNLLMSYKH